MSEQRDRNRPSVAAAAADLSYGLRQLRRRWLVRRIHEVAVAFIAFYAIVALYSWQIHDISDTFAQQSWGDIIIRSYSHAAFGHMIADPIQYASAMIICFALLFFVRRFPLGASIGLFLMGLFPLADYFVARFAFHETIISSVFIIVAVSSCLAIVALILGLCVRAIPGQ